jgi:hypothetical protein
MQQHLSLSNTAMRLLPSLLLMVCRRKRHMDCNTAWNLLFQLRNSQRQQLTTQLPA